MTGSSWNTMGCSVSSPAPVMVATDASIRACRAAWRHASASPSHASAPAARLQFTLQLLLPLALAPASAHAPPVEHTRASIRHQQPRPCCLASPPDPYPSNRRVRGRACGTGGGAWSGDLHGGPVLASALDQDGSRSVRNVAQECHVLHVLTCSQGSAMYQASSG
jgi:hypothetical protein